MNLLKEEMPEKKLESLIKTQGSTKIYMIYTGIYMYVLDLDSGTGGGEGKH